MRKRYNFDRKGMAQGIGVYADNIDDAFILAEEYQIKLVKNKEFDRCCTLTFRDHFDPRVAT